MRSPIRAKAWLLGLLIGLPLVATARADEEHAKLPPGPIKDRIELMEHVGDDAEAINDALKAGKPADAADPADRIAAAMPKFDALFPEGSTGEGSRAKPSIWTSRDEFDAFSTYLKKDAEAVAAAARSGGDVKTASRKMFKACKSCHQKFRQPKEGEEG